MDYSDEILVVFTFFNERGDGGGYAYFIRSHTESQ